MSGERRLPACSVWQPAERILPQFTENINYLSPASCRRLQAGSLCSPDMSIIIRKGRVIDPANKRDERADLLIVDGKIVDVSRLSTLNSQPDEIDAGNLIVAPGLIDIHVHLREPGF